MGLVRYVSHPEVKIDASIPVPEWSLSEVGRQRAESAATCQWASNIDQIVTSSEVKAIETAEILSMSSGAAVEIRDGIGEIDRSSTGYVPHERHEELADLLFERPHESAQGWERAIDATSRMMTHLADVWDCDGHVVIVGHGGVGTLVMCALGGFPIARSRDQPHGGCHWVWSTTEQRLVHEWRPIDAEDPPLGGVRTR